MSEILNIRLQNFKGASDVTIDLAKRTSCPIITLVGLNESGKTTVLEGLSYFVTGDNAVTSLFGRSRTVTAAEAFIPINRKAAFSEDISVTASIRLDDSDYRSAAALAAKHQLEIDRSDFPKEFEVSRTYSFEDSIPKSSANMWDFDLKVRGKKSKRAKAYVRPESESDSEKPDFWDEITDEIARKLPRIACFPTFLVDTPAKIYLREHDNERPVNRYYRYVFQDILDSLQSPKLSLDKHVINRIEEFKENEQSPNWLSILFGGPSRAPINSVFQKMSAAVTKEVIGGWRRVFQRQIAAKSISITWNVDTQNGDLPYASFSVSDGESLYPINDRSLGFRWFFSFLLFTAFKQAAKRKTIFLFDEPAANLHAKAQAELLDSFSRITAGGHRIIYSTHSHHMINPQWLSGAYIIENTALDHDSADAFGLSTRPTNIIATSYKQFVAQSPSRTSYFQPVIEKLEYVTPEIVGSAPYLIIEGISDYYALKLVKEICDSEVTISLMPGCGAGASGPLLSLLLGRGEKFIVLLDDATEESGSYPKMQ